VLKTAAIALLLSATCSFAQEENNKPPSSVKRFANIVECDLLTKLTKIVIDWEEQPIGIGKSLMISPDGNPIRGEIMLFWNPDTKSYTLIMKMDEQYGCLISVGEMQLLQIPAGGTAI